MSQFFLIFYHWEVSVIRQLNNTGANFLIHLETCFVAVLCVLSSSDMLLWVLACCLTFLNKLCFWSVHRKEGTRKTLTDLRCCIMSLLIILSAHYKIHTTFLLMIQA